MSSSCVQATYQNPLSHEGQQSNMRFVNPNTLTHQQQGASYDYNQYLLKRQQQERRFSYASMLSDSDACYLPTITNSSPSTNHSSDDFHHHHQQQQEGIVSPSPSANATFYVDCHTTKHHAMPLEQHQRLPYYDATNYSQYYHSQTTNSNYPSMISPPASTFLSKQQSRPMTPVSPPLLVKDSSNNYNYQQQEEDSTKQQQVKKAPRSRGRRVSNVPGCGARMFTCKADGCGKVFKRSEHLKRHIRSIHTLEKPFECPYQSCNKRFSRSDNLNQHIRIHRHNNSNNNTKDIKLAATSKHHHHTITPTTTTTTTNMKPAAHATNTHFNTATNSTNTFSNFI